MKFTSDVFQSKANNSSEYSEYLHRGFSSVTSCCIDQSNCFTLEIHHFERSILLVNHHLHFLNEVFKFLIEYIYIKAQDVSEKLVQLLLNL